MSHVSRLSRRTFASSSRCDDGFTIIEVLVAATLLLIGVFATLALLDNGVRTTAVSKQRDVANALGQELIERAQGGSYTLTRNDMTDVDTAAPRPRPADRMRGGIDPDGDAAPTAVAPATVTSGPVPGNAMQSWTLRRKNTTYTVSYRACTVSDTYQQVRIAGPYDCDRPSTNPGGGDTATSNRCSLGIIPPTQVNPADPGTLTVRLQVLGLVGLNGCLGAALPDLSAALCTLAGSSTLLNGVTGSLLGSGGLLTGLLGGINSGATVGLCPVQVEQGLLGAADGIASSTRVAVTVAWTGLDGRPRSIAQTAIVRRAVA